MTMEIATLVIDNGASSIRAGFGGDTEPKCILPTILGRTKSKAPPQTSSPPQDLYVGAEVSPNSSSLSLKCPINDRVITQMEDMELIWKHIFDQELHITPSEHPILMTEPPNNEKSVREEITQIMMEKFKVPAFYLAYPGLLSLFSVNKTTGIVIDSGESITQILPVFECFGMTHVLTELRIGGRQISSKLKKLLGDSNISIPGPSERQTIQSIKEKLCYIAPDFDHESRKDITEVAETYKQADGTSISIGHQRFQAPEILFSPQMGDVQSPGLSQLLADTISKCDSDLRQAMASNIVLSGGSSLFNGLPERLEREVGSILPNGMKPVVEAPANRRLSAWIGGSIMVSLSSFSQMWITKAEYDEIGSQIVHLKCI